VYDAELHAVQEAATSLLITTASRVMVAVLQATRVSSSDTMRAGAEVGREREWEREQEQEQEWGRGPER